MNIFDVKYFIMLANILFAGICGFLVGLERSHRLKEAGIRTHVVVAIASALMMSISLNIPNSDPARIAAQIVSGIGFLGAGMIFFRRENLRGLTTAAGIWATAGLGMAAGSGMYIVCLGVTLFLVVFQLLFHSKLNGRSAIHMFSLEFVYDEKTLKMIKEFFNVDGFNRLRLAKHKEDGEEIIIAKAVIHVKKQYNTEQVAELLSNKNMISYERLEDL